MNIDSDNFTDNEKLIAINDVLKEMITYNGITKDAILKAFRWFYDWAGEEMTADVPVTNVGEWIPCSERLPESYKVVVASIRAETGYIKKPYVWDVCKAYCCGDGSWETSLSGTRNLVVEAWMPLPEPYKEGVKE